MIVFPRSVGTFLISRLLTSHMFSAVSRRSSISSPVRSLSAIMSLCLNPISPPEKWLFLQHHVHRVVRSIKIHDNHLFRAGRNAPSDKVGANRQLTVPPVHQ